MPYPAPFLRLVVGGDLYPPVEQFTFSMSLFNDAPGPPGPPDEVPVGVRNAIQSFWTTSNITTQSAVLRWVKLNEIGIDGRYTQDTTVRFDWAEPFPVGSSTALIAPQLSLAVTLRTDVERGPASRGRFYIPLPARNLTSGGVLGETDANAYALAASTLIEDINEAMDPYRVVVMSDSGSGQRRIVRRVEVGRVLDTIRSRRRSFPERYVPGPAIPGV